MSLSLHFAGVFLQCALIHWSIIKLTLCGHTHWGMCSAKQVKLKTLKSAKIINNVTIFFYRNGSKFLHP
jgi:hypothetical protein